MDNPEKSKKINESSVCPECKKEFFCSPSGKCWCAEVFVPPDKLIELSQKYDRCLCPDCLKKYSR
jgi:hypothetical protein